MYSIFFSRPPKVKLAFRLLEANSRFEEYRLCARMQEKNAGKRKIFGWETVLPYGKHADFATFSPSGTIWLPA
jgi:hypothetical protein